MNILPHIQKRDELIDVLRGIAIIIVLMLHFHLSYPLNIFKSWSFDFLMHGNYGVTIFFVISGYLISSNALKRYGDLSSINIKHFYPIRCARILPPLCLALTIISLLFILDLKSFTNSVYKEEVDNPSLTLTIVSVLTFWHNIMMDYYGYFNYAINIYWSLSVEEFFYLIFPIACISLKNKKSIIFILISIIILSPIYRYYNRNDEIVFMYSYLACFDAISIGILSALLKHNRKYYYQKNLIRYIGFALIGFVYFILGIHGFEAIGFTIVSLGTGLIIISSYSQGFKSNIITKILSFLGGISYELYLFHIILLGLIRNVIVPKTLSGVSTIVLLCIFLCSSVLIAHIISKFYSEPINKFFRRRLMKDNCQNNPVIDQKLSRY